VGVGCPGSAEVDGHGAGGPVYNRGRTIFRRDQRRRQALMVELGAGFKLDLGPNRRTDRLHLIEW
jgi:hypothetical protein